MCVSLSNGAENCEYQWTIINDFEEWRYLHKLYSVGGTPETTDGFRTYAEKKVFVYAVGNITKTISHEARHVLCDLEVELLMERIYCHGEIDKENIIEQSSNNNYYQSSEPPTMSAKLIHSTYGGMVNLINQ